MCSSIESVRSEGEVQSMMCDLGFAVKPVLAIDAKATEHILHWQGIGKLKHIDVAYLWVQGRDQIPETVRNDGIREYGRRKCFE